MNKQKLIEHFESLITDRRKELFNRIIAQRTRYITVALEDIYQSQNASAVLRTCDCFGVQDVHIIENRNDYQLNPDVSLGSDKWLNMIKYNEAKNNTIEAISSLKEKGYQIVATTPHTNDVELEKFDLSTGKLALFFGTELNGLTKDVLDRADVFLKIPMYGFTESFNISVSAAVILHHLTGKLRESSLNWQLSEVEKQEIKLDWLRKTVRRSELIEKDFSNNITHNQDLA